MDSLEAGRGVGNGRSPILFDGLTRCGSRFPEILRQVELAWQGVGDAAPFVSY